MTPLQSLRRGIETCDWNLICLAYHNLTGEALDPPSVRDHTGVLRRIADLTTVALAGGPVIATEEQDEKAEVEKGEDREEAAAEIGTPAEQEERVANKSTDGTNVYGIGHKVATQPYVEESERRANAERARKNPKQHRPVPRSFEVTCSECKRQFQSEIAVPKGVGKLCPRCMGSRSRK